MKCSLQELLGWRQGGVTHRQFLAWSIWLEDQWNEPSLTDHYLIRIATEVRRSYVKKPQDVEEKDFRLKFKRVKATKKSTNPTWDKKRISAVSKSIWAARVGLQAVPAPSPSLPSPPGS